MSDEDEFDEFGNPTSKASLEYSEDENEWEDAASDDLDSGREEEEERREFSDFGEEVELAHYSEDENDISMPSASVQKEKKSSEQPLVTYSLEFRWSLARNLRRVRNVAVVGHFGHGKTSLVDILINKNYVQPPRRFTDFHDLERLRQTTLKLGPVSLLLATREGTSYVVNIVDTPGHRDFVAEVECGLHLADGAIVVVDVVEGLLPTAKAAIRIAKTRSQPLIFFFNKIDRLYFELQLSPQRAFERIRVVLDEVNNYLSSIGEGHVDPCEENVLFGSTKFEFVFSIQEFTKLYRCYQLSGNDTEEWKRYLWGNISLIDGEFVPKSKKLQSTFAELVLGPIFKLFSLGMVLSPSILQRKLSQELGMKVSRKELEKAPLLRLISIFSVFFEDCWGTMVNVISDTVPEPTQGKANMPITDIQTDDGTFTLIRVNEPELCGTGLWICQSRYNEKVESVPFGSWALLETELELTPSFDRPVICIGVQPKNPVDRARMELRIAILARVYRQLHVTVEQTGEHTLWGPGELYLDCVMYELRNLNGEYLDVQASDLSVGFRETVAETTSVACPTQTPNAMNSVTILASPLGTGINNIGGTSQDSLKGAGWDASPVKSLIGIVGGSNTLLNEIGEPPNNLSTIMDASRNEITRGAEWAVREGPLCEGLVTGVNFRIIEISLDESAECRNGIQLVQMVRRACYAALMLASPRLLEPWFLLTVIGPVQTGRHVYNLLSKRRGYVTRDEGMHLTRFYVIEGKLPVIDSLGLETEIRVASEGQAHVVFEPLERWRLAPGDPLDTSQKIRRLDKSEDRAIARDFMLKTRKRRGLSPEPQPNAYFDEEFAELIGT